MATRNRNNGDNDNDNGQASGASGQFDIFRMLQGGIGGVFGLLFNVAIIGVIAYLAYRFIPGAQSWVDNLIGNNPQARAFLDHLGIRRDPEAVTDLLRGMSAEEAFTTLQSQHVPEAIANVLTTNDAGERDDTEWHNNVDLLQQAVGANQRITPEALMSPTALNYILEHKPALAQRMLTAIPRPTPGQAPDAMTQGILRTVSGILANEQQFNALFAAHRDTIIAAINQFSPIPFGPGALEQFINGPIGTSNGVPTATLRNFLAATVQGGGAGLPAQALLDLIKSPEVTAHPEALAALMHSVDVAHLPAEMASIVPVVRLLSDTQNVTAVHNLVEHLGADAPQLFTILGTADRTAMRQAFEDFAVTDAHADAFLAFADEVKIETLDADTQHVMNFMRGMTREGLHAFIRGDQGYMAAREHGAWQESVQVIEGLLNGHRPKPRQAFLVLLDPTIRHEITADVMGGMIDAVPHLADPDEEQMRRFFSVHGRDGGHTNINAFYRFADELSNPYNNSPEHAEQFHRVMRGLILYVSSAGNAQALHGLTEQEVSAFFAQPSNRTAFEHFLGGLNVATLSPEQQTLIHALRNNWRDGQGHGLSEVLASQRGAEFGLKMLRGEVGFVNTFGVFGPGGRDFGSFAEVGFDGLRNVFGDGGPLWVNRDHMSAIASAIPQGAGTPHALAVEDAEEIGVPMPTPSGNGTSAAFRPIQ